MSNKFQEAYKKKLLSLEDAAKRVKDGDKILAGQALGLAVGMTRAIGKRAMAGEIHDVDMMGMSLLPDSTEWVQPEYYENMRMNASFVIAPQARKAINEGYGDFIPSHGGLLPKMYTDYIFKDMPKGKAKVIADVSPMDKNGYFSYGTTPGYMVEPARMDNTEVIVEVNKYQPRIYGDNFIHISEVDYIVENDHELPAFPAPDATPEDITIAETILEQIEDGSTIQLGIGGIPNILGKELVNKKDLGAHTEMVGDAFKYLWEEGALTGRKKTVKPYKIVGCFVMASSDVYEWVHENPAVEMYSQAWTNDPYIVGQNNKMITINAGIEIDFTGQVAAETIGPRHYSGTGGQMHFVQGAQLSPGGKSFLCLKSTADTKEGKVSKIVPFLKYGSAVTTARTDVQYIVTEYGIAQLKGKTMKERTKALIAIAHPDFRAELTEEAKKLGFFN